MGTVGNICHLKLTSIPNEKHIFSQIVEPNLEHSTLKYELKNKMALYYSHLICVVRYVPLYSDLRTFCFVNKKCFRVVQNIKTYYFSEENADNIDLQIGEFKKKMYLLKGIQTIFCDVEIYKNLKEFCWEKYPFLFFKNLKLSHLESWMFPQLVRITINCENNIPKANLENVRTIEINCFYTLNSQKQTDLILFLNNARLVNKIIFNTESIHVDSLIPIVRSISHEIKIVFHFTYLVDSIAKLLKTIKNSISIGYQSTNSFETDKYAIQESSLFPVDCLVNQFELNKKQLFHLVDVMNFIGKRQLIHPFHERITIPFIKELVINGVSFVKPLIIDLPSTLKILSVSLCENIEIKGTFCSELDYYSVEACQLMKSVPLLNSKIVTFKSLCDTISINCDYCNSIDQLTIDSLGSLETIYLPTKIQSLSIFNTSIKKIYGIKDVELQSLCLKNNKEYDDLIELKTTITSLNVINSPQLTLINLCDLRLVKYNWD